MTRATMPARKSGLQRKTGMRPGLPIKRTPPEPTLKKRTCADCPAVIQRFTVSTLPNRCAACRQARHNAQTRANEERRGVKAPFHLSTRARKKISARNEKRRPRGAGSAQREKVVIERAGGRCEFEHVTATLIFQGEEHYYTAPCGSTDRPQTVHLARRWKHAAPVHGNGHVVFSEASAFCGCGRHHQLYDSRAYRGKIVVPERYRLAAFLEIRGAELARLQAGRGCAPADLSELLPAGDFTIDNQYAPLGRYAPGAAA